MAPALAWFGTDGIRICENKFEIKSVMKLQKSSLKSVTTNLKLRDRLKGLNLRLRRQAPIKSLSDAWDLLKAGGSPGSDKHTAGSGASRGSCGPS